MANHRYTKQPSSKCSRLWVLLTDIRNDPSDRDAEQSTKVQDETDEDGDGDFGALFESV